MNMTRILLREKNLSNDYWVTIVASSIYIVNRYPTTPCKDKIPQDAKIGKMLNVSHLRMFGSIDFGHIPEGIRKKLDNRNEKCIIVGHSEQSKTYKYKPITK